MDIVKYRIAKFKTCDVDDFVHGGWPTDLVTDLSSALKTQMDQTPPPLKDCSISAFVQPCETGATFAAKIIWVKDEETRLGNEHHLGWPSDLHSQQIAEAIWGLQ